MEITQLVKLKPFLWLSDIDSKTLFKIIGSLNYALEALAINSSRLHRLLPLLLMLRQAMLTMSLPVHDTNAPALIFESFYFKIFWY